MTTKGKKLLPQKSQRALNIINDYTKNHKNLNDHKNM